MNIKRVGGYILPELLMLGDLMHNTQDEWRRIRTAFSHRQSSAMSTSVLNKSSYGIEDLEEDLSHVIGLEDVKNTVRQLYATVMIEQKRRKQGLSQNSEVMSIHMAFLGNAGTGNTFFCARCVLNFM